MSHPRAHLSRSRTFWSLRYKIYVLLLLVMVTPLLGFNNSNIPPSISFLGTKTIPVFPWYSKVVRRNNDSIPNLVSDILNQDIIQGGEVTLATNDIEKTIQDQIKNNKNLPLDKLIPRPKNPKDPSFLRYPQYSINAPIIWSQMSDLFQANDDGTLKRDSKGAIIPIEEDQNYANNPLAVPIQRLLVDGVVHLAYTPAPGEIGNSYIVGHSSNFSSIVSNYNTIFKPIQEKSKAGEEFFINDKYGRNLKFKVFESLKIEEGNVKEAYKTYDDKRVVTLQTSILSVCYSSVTKTTTYQPCHRWLTRGELVLE
jgi:Sortase domain